MNFSFSKGPPGPLYTVVHVRFSQNSLQQDKSQQERVWADCIAEIAKDPAWGFTLQGRSHDGEVARTAILIFSWKGNTDTKIPSWTTMSNNGPAPASSSPFAPLLPVLDSPPQVLNVTFRPLLSNVHLHPDATITDITTLYIPADIADTPELAEFGRQMHGFSNESAHVSHEPAGPMISSSQGWAVGEIERGEKGGKMVVHVLLHTWGSREEERGYKKGKDGEYERLFLKPLREVERLGVGLERVQVGLEPVRVKEKGHRERKGCCVV